MAVRNLFKIEQSENDKNEYIIKDNDSLNAIQGKINVLDYQVASKFCLLRLRTLGDTGQKEEAVTEVIDTILDILFRQQGIVKVSLLTSQNIDFSALLSSGFELEGIVSNSFIKNNIQEDELLFGIEAGDYSDKLSFRNLIIEGKRVNLKLLLPGNEEELLAYYINNEKHLAKKEPLRGEPFYTIEGQRELILEGYRQYLKGTSLNLGIFLKEKLIGRIQLSNIVMGVLRSAIVGYSIDSAQEGKGYMKEALKLIIKYGFEEMELHRIEASTLEDNIRSQNVLKACDFELLGLNKKYLFINGKWRDHYIYYLTN